MKDSEIVKALECCVGEQYTCEQCPYQEKKHYDYDNDMFEIMPNGLQYDQWSCDRWLLTDLLDLINRLQADNERLTAENILLNTDTTEIKSASFYFELEKQRERAEKFAEKRKAEIKAEAYKEFAFRLKKEYSLNQLVSTEDIDDLLKELVGEDNVTND